jgi:hypothetical protein
LSKNAKKPQILVRNSSRQKQNRAAGSKWNQAIGRAPETKKKSTFLTHTWTPFKGTSLLFKKNMPYAMNAYLRNKSGLKFLTRAKKSSTV